MNYRKPQDLKVLTGTFRPDREHVSNHTESDLPDKISTPSHLGSAGKSQWRKLVKLLQEEELLKKVDLGCLEACCLAYDEMIQSSYDMRAYRKKQLDAERAINLVEDPDEMKTQLALIKHHASMIDKSRNAKNKAMQLYHKFMNEFGLSPGSRIRLDLNNEKEEPSEFEKAFGMINTG